MKASEICFEDVLLRSYLTNSRTLDDKARRTVMPRFDSPESEVTVLADLAEQIHICEHSLEQNSDIIVHIILEMRKRLNDDSFHSPDDFRDDLKSALIRMSSYNRPSNDHSRTDTPEDRTRRFQMEHDRIHNMFRTMNPDSAVGDFDLDVSVGGFIFNCHKQIMSSHSPFFAQQVKDYGHRSRTRVRILEIDTDTFMIIFRYIYSKYFCSVSLKNILLIWKAVKYLSMDEISIRCTKIFLEHKSFWELIVEWKCMTESTCGEEFDIQVFFNYDHFLVSSKEITLRAVTYNSNLNARQETDVCDLILAWLNKHETCEEAFILVMESVRWSSVPEEYVRSIFMNNEKIKSRPEVLRFLSALLDKYYKHGVPVQMQRTFIRSSLGYEKCFVGVEMDIYGNFNVTMRRIQRELCQSYVSGAGKFRVELNDSISGAVYHEYSQGSSSWQRDTLYLTGTGKRFKGILKYDISTGWSKCPDMVVDRKHHRSVFVGSKLFSCGGLARCTIEEFDVNNNTSKMRKAELLVLTDVGCIAYEKYIFFFGGSDKGVCFDQVQRYDTETDRIWSYHARMPFCLSGWVPVACGDVIILLHEETCLINDVKTSVWSKKAWTEKVECGTNFSHFAAVLEDDKIFTFGGTTDRVLGLSGDHAFVQFIDTEAVVPSVAANDGSQETPQEPPIVEAEWKWCGNLNPRPIHYLAYGTMAVPCEKFKDGSWTWASQ